MIIPQILSYFPEPSLCQKGKKRVSNYRKINTLTNITDIFTKNQTVVLPCHDKKQVSFTR